MNIPEEANVVIIGGGVIGCSIAYHLGKLGWKDILLLERKKLTCGTTWHAAGLIAQLRATQNMTRLAKYSQELYWDLEKETGVVTGFKRNGSMTVALTEERLEELNRQADMARAYDVEIENIDKAEIKSRYPHLNTEDVLGGLWLPKDGQADPVNITQALAKGARNFGVKILEDLIILARERKKKPVEGSYTNKLLEDETLSKEKVLEEIGELIESVEKNTNKIHEAADVFYHLIMYLEKSGIKIEDVMEELNSRKK